MDVTCRVTGFRVADGNNWWYQIGSSPWNNTYYASADAFYNNGQTSGSLAGTPFYDPAVPVCGAGTAPAPPPQPSPSVATTAETTGGVTHTWTNYVTASGNQGPSISSNQTVQVTCRVTGFAVADGNTWWYQIASAPWSNLYYASADAFYNNGQTSGSLTGTPFYDPAVPLCGASSATGPPATSFPSTGTTPAETTGGVTHTWTNYVTASGSQGPSISSNQTVQVTCRVTGFAVADGNTWWYEIASAPWSNLYYASADAFYNNGHTSGTLVGTPFVDPAVPICGSTGPPPPAAPLPAPSTPVLAHSVNVALVQGVVLVSTPPNTPQGSPGKTGAGNKKSTSFASLTRVHRIPTGSQIDALRGTVALTVAVPGKRTKTVRLSGAVFTLTQSGTGLQKGLTTLTLNEGSTFPNAPSSKGCVSPASIVRTSSARIARKLSRRVLQTLRSSDRGGSFRTRGRYSAATVRGTIWNTKERCDGTLTIVISGTVSVQDFHTHKTITVHAGHSYLAQAPVKRRRPR